MTGRWKGFTLCLVFCFAIFFSLIASSKIKPAVSLMGGVALTHFKTTENITLLPPYQDTFTGSNNDDTPFGGIFAGIESPFYQDFLWQIGLSYYQTSAFTAKGRIWQFTNPDFNNISYQEQIKNQQILIETKFLGTINKKIILHPYLTAALGEAINTASDYTETALQPYVVKHPADFSDHTSHAFSYAFGLGLDVELTDHVRFGVGYRYAYLGRAQLGTMPGQESDDRLTEKNLATNAFLFNISLLG